MSEEEKIIKKIEFGQALTPESWLGAADQLAGILALLIAEVGKTNAQAANEISAISQLAYTAMVYVSECATDKCRIIVLPDEGKS